MLTASHTHSGPVIRENLIDMYGLSAEEAAKVQAYSKQLKADLVEVIGAAVKKLEPANLKYAHGSAGFAMNRREPTAKGIINGLNRDGPVDHTVPVLVVEGADAKPRAIVFGYACHNTTVDLYQWSGDYAGFAQIGIEKAFPGTVAMFWTGCGADANPQPRRKLELCERHGRNSPTVVYGKGACRSRANSARSSRRSRSGSKRSHTGTVECGCAQQDGRSRKRAERMLKELTERARLLTRTRIIRCSSGNRRPD
jgi:hypothetical protein